MGKWKLTRQLFGCEEYTLSEGDKVTIGRGTNNTITLSSVVISRNHCVINIQNNKVLITDLQSSNGVYVGTVKIPPNTPYVIEDSDIIGLGWTMKAPLVNIEDSEKYVFKLSKDKTKTRLTNRIEYDTDLDNIEREIAKINDTSTKKETLERSPVLCTKLSLKRKIGKNIMISPEKKKKNEVNYNSVINISDSDSDFYTKPSEMGAEKPKLKSIEEEPQKHFLKNNEIKNENELIEYDAFSVKQEYLGYDDEPIKIDSDTDTDSESEQWLLRLSQNSPGKPFTKLAKSIKLEVKPEDGSYSQIEDDFIANKLIFEDDDDEEHDIISIPEPAYRSNRIIFMDERPEIVQHNTDREQDEFSDDITSVPKSSTSTVVLNNREDINRDEVDGCLPDNLSKQTAKLIKSPLNEPHKKTQMIEALAQMRKGKAQQIAIDNKTKKSASKYNKIESLPSKKHNESAKATKEERKKKLKELATKDKDNESRSNKDSPSTAKRIINVKVTSSNRGAFLTDLAQAIVKPVKRIEEANKSREKIIETLSDKNSEPHRKSSTEHSKLRHSKKHSEKSRKDKSKSTKHKDPVGTENKPHNNLKKHSEQDRVPLKSLKPLADSEDSFSGKPVSKVVPMPAEKQKKKVRFSEAPPQVREFEIQPGNRMKKTSLVKTTLVDVRQTPVFSLERITLMKVLRWNPHWLEEQLNNADPPPILGHNNTPMALFHSFENHNQYVQLVGDLLLMEIWECLTIAYMKTQQHKQGMQLIIESLPPMPSQERCFELFNITVNVSIQPSETKKLPRVGEIMLINFGPENLRNLRFVFVHNVRQLPPPPGQTNYFYNISLQASVTEKMALLRPGEIIIGKTLAYINKELMLFEAMEYLASSPLNNAILKPERHHFTTIHPSQYQNMKSPWTMTLNPSQLKAVYSSVFAALSDKPSIQLVQGPPGTGKSTVICSTIMTYFYDAQGKKLQNRGKILICATSNAAVDGLVIRLLNLRQSLPKSERFRMVRVGRAEAMHPLAADMSSQQLALRDLARAEPPPAAAGLHEEILHLEAKINMWKTAEQDAKDPVRVAYCQGRVSDLIKRITLLRAGGSARGGPVRPEQLASAERRIVEGADIVVTTLASAHNHKIRGLKRRIALCIIDEAGQVIEPETLVPLTLDVTRLTLIGDPQQLPGFICSQRAKKHGLGESLFSRLTSSSDDWAGGSPVILLNQQYRMHPDIVNYPSRAFYGGMVETIAPVRPDIAVPPYTIISIASGDKGQAQSGANELESWGVVRLALALDAILRARRLRLAIITPYNAHKELIKRHLRALHAPSSGEGQLEVNTVDSFQGQERDVVLVSLARSQGVGFLTDTGRMNVMLTRAKHALIICLNPNALLKNNQWRTLVEDAQRRSLYKTLPNKMCQPITAAQVSTDNILKYVIQEEPRSSCR